LETQISSAAATSTFTQTAASGGFLAPPIKINDVDVPLFIIDDDKATTFTFAFKGTPLAGLADAIKSTVDSPADDTEPDVGVETTGFILGNDDDLPPAIDLKSVTITGLAVDGTVTFPLAITITPDYEPEDDSGPTTVPLVPATHGLARIFINLPVYLFDNTSPGAGQGTESVTWYFRSGLNNPGLDTGYVNQSLGGAILIGVGPDLIGLSGKKDIIVTWK